MSEPVKVTNGSGDVFTDLGLPDASELEEKFQLALAIQRAIEEQGLTQSEAAAVTGLNQADISRIKGFKRLDAYSCSRLMNALIGLGKDLRITISDAPPTRTRGRLSFEYA